MRINGQTDAAALSALGAEALRLLYSGDISTLAGRFGYALAYDREPAAAIGEDLKLCLSEVRATSLKPLLEYFEPIVKYFEPNDTGLFAVVECFAGTDNDSRLLVELIVTGDSENRHVTLEQISAAA